ncbi:Olfactory receptor 4L1 [Fukomys damarensis]|uniref:Olfactory receptor n=1 Tax=Fukomys damarensis TaxID=885580 RepID=A0A091CTG6_FUKDA|nr:Olfactory receptor 4L1 [Fukomys damarensis]
MYFLLGNLSFLDMCISTITTPKMVTDFLRENKAISLWGCMAQMFFLHFLGGSEMTLLIVMAVDRYVAICRPLHYTAIMNRRVLLGSVLLSWAVGFVHTMSQMVFMATLPFCGPNVVDNIFCDLPLVIKLACTETYVLELLVIADSGLLSFICFVLLLVSYTVILVTVRRQSSGGSEMTLLIVMAVDRYVAICRPLHYTAIMNRRVLLGSVLLSWAVGFVHTMSQMVFMATLPFCGPNVVDNIFCDLPLVIKLACTETYVLELLVIADSGLLSFICFVLLLVSYTVILVTVRRQSSGGLSKALSTLSAHITVVTLFFGPCIFIYAWPFRSFSVDKFLSVFYSVITPLLNPVIYTLRNQEMKSAMSRLRTQHISSRQI